MKELIRQTIFVLILDKAILKYNLKRVNLLTWQRAMWTDKGLRAVDTAARQMKQYRSSQK